MKFTIDISDAASLEQQQIQLITALDLVKAAIHYHNNNIPIEGIVTVGRDQDKMENKTSWKTPKN